MIPKGTRRLFRFPWRTRADVRNDIRDEFQFHLDMRTDELAREGLSRDEARAQALREFGDQRAGAAACARVDTRVEWRDRVVRQVEDLARDVRLACRTLLRAPWFSLVAVATLALGIGATAAIYSMFEQALFRPLPVHDPSRLVNFSAPGPKPGGDNCDQSGPCDDVLDYPMYEDLAALSPGFSGIAGHRALELTLRPQRAAQAEWGTATLVSGNYFDVLGLAPNIGRLLSREDIRAAAPVAVLSYDYWRSRFGGDPSAIGESIHVNDAALTIVGVAPPGFSGTTLGLRPGVFMPITLRTTVDPFWGMPMTNRGMHWVYVFGRLAPGVSMAQASDAINLPYARILDEVEAPLQSNVGNDTLARFKAKRLILSDGSRGQSRLHDVLAAPLFLLIAVTAIVLLIACANLANLQLVRAAGRAGELAVRLSIGGSRWQLVRQLVVESLVLAAAGGAAGLLVAQATLASVMAMLPGGVADMAVDFSVDGRAMAFAGVLTVGAALVFGLVPALKATGGDVASTLKDQSGQPSGARSSARLRTMLCAAQVALAMALLVAAGLFGRSLVNVSRVSLGLDPAQVVTFAVAPGLNGYSADGTRAFAERLEAELSGIPGVTSASVSVVRVLSGQSNGGNLKVQGFTTDLEADTNVRFQEVGSAYFETMEIPLLAGRAFTDADTMDAPKVAIVNEAFVKKFGLGDHAVGTRLARRSAATLDTEIVGVVRDSKYSDVKRDTPAVLFRPYRQRDELFGMYFYVRAAMAPDGVMAAIPGLVAGIDPAVPVRDLMTLPQQVRENTFLDRLVSLLSLSFALAATLMAAIGLYGVLAYSIAQRTREIGLRMALGADASEVRGMVFRQVARMTLSGGAAGVGVALALGTAARSLLFGLEPFDPLVVAASVGVLAIVALAAGLIPAMRAARIDPMRALKWE